MLKSSETLQQHLIIFTRYPEPGKTKTRLIPALGTIGAAKLQRQMTEYALFQVKELQKLINISLEIRFAGGDLQLMQDWLGAELVYHSQGDGDLGSRMARSLYDSFQGQAKQVVIIGTDCPGLNSHILAQAFEQIYTVDLVLGPAIDGGYYLIALRRFIPELFANIDWGLRKYYTKLWILLINSTSHPITYHHWLMLIDQMIYPFGNEFGKQKLR